MEAYNSSLRRKDSAYRRKTNTYAKDQKSLQRTLDLQWVVNNFITNHFTTKKVPAIALGIITSALSWKNIFSINLFLQF